MANLYSELTATNQVPTQGGAQPVNLYSELKPAAGTLTPEEERKLRALSAGGGVAGVGASFLRGAFSPEVLAKHPKLAPFARGLAQGAVNVPLGLAQAVDVPGVKQVSLPGTDTGWGEAGKFLSSAVASTPLYEAGAMPARAGAEALGIAEKLPAMSRYAARYAGGVLPAIAQVPKHPVIAGIAGGLLANMLPGAGALAKGTVGVARKIIGREGNKLGTSILDSLSGGLYSSEGSNAIPENAKQFASEVKAHTNGLIDKYNALKGDAYKYDNTKLPTTAFDSNLPEKITGDSEDMLNEFKQNPTMKNAHLLQSALGREGTKLSGATDFSSQKIGKEYLNARNSLKDDMGAFLDQQDPSGNLRLQNENASDFYKNKIAPLHENKQLWKVARGKITRPINIHNLINNPKTEELSSVLNDLPQQTKNRAIFSWMAQGQGKVKPSALASKFSNLGGKRLNEYVDPNMQKDINLMKNVGDLTRSERAVKNVLPYAIRGAAMGAGGLGAYDALRHILGE
jgi:hypothetical protein